jgi:hypothetical protein
MKITQKTIDFDGASQRAADTARRMSVLELWTTDEIWEKLSPELLPKFYEDARVERKPAGIHAEPLATYVCMWANTAPVGGIVLLGIEDKTGDARTYE